MKTRLKRYAKYAFVALFVMYLGALAYDVTKAPENAPEQPKVAVAEVEPPKPKEPEVSYLSITELLEETNKHRVAHGVGKVTLSEVLHRSAQDKCSDMVGRHYWSHNTPEGVDSGAFINRYVKYNKAGENLRGHVSSETKAPAVVQSWMNSPTHRVNLLDPVFRHVGFGVCKSEKYTDEFHNMPTVIVVQHLTD